MFRCLCYSFQSCMLWNCSNWSLSGRRAIVSNRCVSHVTQLGTGPLTSFALRPNWKKLKSKLLIIWFQFILERFCTIDFLTFSQPKVLTFGVLKLSATDVAISLPGIVPTFSSSLTFKFCWYSRNEVDVWLSDGGSDEDDWQSIMSKFQSKSYFLYICLLACCLCISVLLPVIMSFSVSEW